nr:ORF2 [Porcine astrovirus 4]
MANNQNNVQPKVVTTTTTTTRRRGGRRRRRTPRTSQAGTTTVRRVTTTRQPGRPPRRRRNRFGNSRRAAPGSIRQRITATLGTVGSNQGNDIELEMSCLLNPALMKETTGSNQHGPLQILASTYSLWKVDYLALKLTPLIGSSAVSGTAVRASYNLSGQPGSSSWSALGARKHKDTNPGRQTVFYLSGSDFKGPKDGWFFCNTKNDPQMCMAGSLEIHTLGKTMSTYKNEAFDGPLFLVELTAEWWFKNYNPEPGMMNLVKTDIQEEAQQVKIHSKPGEPIVISVPQNSSFARATGSLGVEAGATPSEIIWSVFDTTMDIITGTFPPPFQWLFSAGWWFVKRIANKKTPAASVTGEPDAGEVTFQVFQSLSDAQNDVPCIATGEASSTNTNITGWHVTQVTPGNVGNPAVSILSSRASEATLDPIEVVSTPNMGQSAFYGHSYTKVPPFCIAVQEALGDKKVYTYIIWDIDNPSFLQNGQLIEPAQLQSQPYPILAKRNSDYTPIGKVYAANYARIGSSKPMWHWTTVLWRADVDTTIQMQGTSKRTDKFAFIQPTQSQQPNNFPTTTYSVNMTQAYSFSGGHAQTKTIYQGKWYLSSFVACQIADNKAPEFTNYGVPFYLSVAFPPSDTSQYDLPREAFDVGAAMQTTRPLILKPPVPTTTVLTASEVAQLRLLLAPQNDYPTSEYDNLEMPPPEGEEEEEQGAVGGYTPLEGTRQQKVRPPAAIGVFKSGDTTPPLEDTEEEDDEDCESDLDDDDYAEIPSLLKYLLTPEAKSLCDDLKRKGLDHEIAVKAAQTAFPHPARKIWEASYHNALVDGLSPPSARDCAWSAISEYI